VRKKLICHQCCQRTTNNQRCWRRESWSYWHIPRKYYI